VVRALAAVAPATRCGVCCLSFVEPCAAGRIGGTGDLPVEALEMDAVGGAPTAISPMRALPGWVPGGTQTGSPSPRQALP